MCIRDRFEDVATSVRGGDKCPSLDIVPCNFQFMFRHKIAEIDHPLLGIGCILAIRILLDQLVEKVERFTGTRNISTCRVDG